MKIDRSIIKAAETDEDARKIVRVIVDLVHSFDLQACTEGVETEAAEFSCGRLDAAWRKADAAWQGQSEFVVREITRTGSVWRLFAKEKWCPGAECALGPPNH